MTTSAWRPPHKHLRLLAGVLLAALAAAAVWIVRSDSRTTDSEPQAPSEEGWFEDITATAGVSASHVNRTFDNPYAEIMQGYTALGASAAVADVDGDGWEDIFFTRSNSTGANLLYRNNGNFTFTDIAAAAGVAAGNDDLNASANSLWFDADNDGDPELLLVRFGQSLLYENLGPTDEVAVHFADITVAAGLGARRMNSIEAIAFDYDLDGDLDLFIANYFAPVNLFDPETPRFFPESFETAKNGGGVVVYQNRWVEDRALRFVDATAASGLAGLSGWSLDLGHADADHDGDDDLYIAADFGSDSLLRNNGDGTFADLTSEAIGIDTKKGMNVDWGDFDRDGLFDIYVTNITDEYMNEGNFLWQNQFSAGPDEHLSFIDVARETGARDTGWGWAAKFFDYDNNGWLDLFVVNGWVSGLRGPDQNYVRDIFQLLQDPEVDLADARGWPPIGAKTLSGYQSNVLWRNNAGFFSDVAPLHGLDSQIDARGIALADFDHDGRTDIFVTNAGQPPLLYRNVQPTTNHWFALELEGRDSNRDAVGARVWIETDAGAQVGFVNGGNGFASQSSRRLLFGVGSASSVERLVVVWPSGQRQEFPRTQVDTRYRLIEGGTLERDSTSGTNGPARVRGRGDRGVTAPADLLARFDHPNRENPPLGPAAEFQAGHATGPAQAIYHQGIEAFGAGRGGDALDLLEQALEVEPNNLRYGADYRQMVIAMAQDDPGTYERSIGFFERLTLAHPEAASARLNLAFAFVDQLPSKGAITQVIQANTALTHFGAAIALEDSWLARYARGNALLFWPPIFGRVPAAQADLRRAIEISESQSTQAYHARAWVALGDSFWRLDDLDSARETWRAASERYPADPDLAARLGFEDRAELERLLQDRYDTSRPVDTSLRELFQTVPGSTRLSPGAVKTAHISSRATGPRFEDVTASAGATFVHHTRRFGGPKHQVLEMFTHGGAAVAVGDYDNDGDDDLFVTDSALGAPNRLLRNDTTAVGRIQFVEVGALEGVQAGNGPHAIVADALWLDYDNDNNLDLYLGRFGSPLLFRNRGANATPRFEDVSQRVGLTEFANTIGTVTFDADGDGFLDLMLANYFAPVDLTRLQTRRVLPNNLDNADNGGGVTFLRNVPLPDGTRGFRNDTRRAGLADQHGWSLDIGHADLDNDGDQDVYVAGDFGTDRLFWGQGDGTFVDGTAAALGGHDTRKGMNVDMGDPDRDGWLDIYVTNITDDYMKECNFFWQNLGTGSFVDISRENGTCDSDWGWAAKFGDFDNDGFEDLFVVNGLRSRDRHADYIPLLLETTILKPDVDFADLESYPDIGTMSWSGYQRQRLFHNLGDGTFDEVAEAAGVGNDLDGRGIGVGDFDGDGLLDLYQANVDQPALLYRGVTPNPGNWIELHLRGTTSNRNAIGARVGLRIGEATLTREVNGGNGYASASSLRLHFGLGQAQHVDGITVRWPSGLIEELPGPALNQIHTIEEGRGVIQP